MTRGPVSLLLAACLVGSANAAGAETITHENYDELSTGKNVFIKFVRTQIHCSILDFGCWMLDFG